MSFSTWTRGLRQRLSAPATGPALAAPAPGTDVAPRAGRGLAALLTEQAVDELMALLTQMPDPDLVLWQAGISRADLRVLEGDDEIAAALETRREALVTTPWRLEPYDDNAAAAWLWEELADHLPGLLRTAWAAVPYGYSVAEVIYRRAEGGRLGLARISEKPFEWFEPTRDGGLIYRPARGGEQPVDTVEKFLVTVRLPTYRQPYGEALLSRLYWPWFFRTHGWQFWGRFLERHGSPLLVGKSKNTGLMRDALVAAVQSAVLAVDRDDEVTGVAPGNAGDAFDRFTAAVERRIQKVILGQTLTTDVSGTGGSFAAAKVHDAVRDDRRRADIALVTGTVQRLIDALCRRNFPGAEVPRFILADDRGLEAARAERDAKLVQAGVLQLTEAYLLDRYDFEPGDFTVPAPSPGGRPGAPALTLGVDAGVRLAAGPPAGAPPARFSPGQMDVERLIDAAVARAASPIPAARLRSVIAAASDPADLTARLAAVYGDSDRADFTRLLEQALFTADVLGYANAEAGRD